MSQHTLIVHGYSDCSESFIELKERLKEEQIGSVDTILYGDYESREDNITFNDVIDGLNDQMIDKGLIARDGKKREDLNIVVHSTGGLVIRHWLWRYYHGRVEDCPVKRLVMLAPANFGSPLAHRGKSFLGRLVKGRWKIGDFLEVGRELLNGLELASPYQWEMAHRDIFSDAGSYFNRDQIQLTILVGIEDYFGIRGWVNKPGTDGTVVIAGTSLNSVKLGLDFCDPTAPYQWKETKTVHDFAFGVLPELNHGSIVGRFSDENSQITKLTVEALRNEDSREFGDYREKLKRITDQTYEFYANKFDSKYSRYQQFIIRGIDDHGEPVSDYTIEFYVYKAEKAEDHVVEKKRYFNKSEKRLSEVFHKALIGEIHTNKEDPSFRRLLINLEIIDELIKKAQKELGPFVISMKIFVPQIDKGIYYDLTSLQNVVIYQSEPSEDNIPALFFNNTTTLIEFKIDRKTSYVSLNKEPKK